MKSRILILTCAIGFSALVTTAQQPQQTANPVPLINQPLSPAVQAPGAAAFTLTLNGSGFVSGTTVYWNGGPLQTHFVSASQLTAAVPASDIAVAGTASVTVVSPSPGGGASNPAYFSVTVATKIALARNDFATAGGDPEGAAVADLNGDGKLDLVVANAGCCGFGAGNTIAVLLGNGDGTFQAAVLYSTGNKPMWIAVGDFNGDGKLDVATANQVDNTVSILLGNGDGTFQTAIAYATGSSPETVMAADFNGDGKLDLAVANSMGGNSVSILLGNGDGTFQPHMEFATGVDPRQAVTGDFNGDGKLDLATTNYDSGNGNTVSILLGNGDGTFQPHVDYGVGSGPFGITVADFNGDGKLDLAVTDGGPCCLVAGLVSILMGKGDGTFQEAHSYASGGTSPTRITAADFNGDGKVDLAVTDINASLVTILLGSGDGKFSHPGAFATGTRPVGLLAADFNGDGRMDLAVAASQADTVSVLLQAPSVSLSPASLQFANQTVGTSSAAQTVDVTNTGYLPLNFSGITVTGADAVDFSQSNTCGSSLAAGASCTIGVTFKPAHAGALTAAVTITDNGAGNPQSVALSGTGVISGPNATLSPTSLAFATQVVGAAGAAQSVTLANYGTSELNIATIAFTGADGSDFAQTNTCPLSLAVGVSCTINVTFTPSQRGARTASLSIADNAIGSPQLVSLQGTGTAVALNPASLNFNTVAVGTSRTLTTTLTNFGSAPVSLSGITITGTDSAVFTETTTCGPSVGAGASCTIAVTFSPTSFATSSATLSISDNGGASPQTISLQGTGGSATYTVLYTFTGGVDGAAPFSGVIRDSADNLYGTTSLGGAAGAGVVYKLAATGQELPLYAFTGGNDGGYPSVGVIRDSAGNLYGTTEGGGTAGEGVVYEVAPTGQESVLHTFTGGADGGLPVAGVIRDSGGNLYGTTQVGGAEGVGVVFELNPGGQESELHTFTGGADGAIPGSGVIRDADGNLYGTATQGGTANWGVVYKLDTAGNQTVLYNFSGGADGGFPVAGVIRDSAGNLYGTSYGGTGIGFAGFGVVYKIDINDQETVLYTFTGGADGGYPNAVIRDSAGNLYGTANAGGTAGFGVVFKLDTAGNQTVLYNFTGGTDGGYPSAGLIPDGTGNLYSTASAGGNLGASACGGSGCGVVFMLTPSAEAR
jgi:uncharacterized repeat protein (TIGR03803 family)